MGSYKWVISRLAIVITQIRGLTTPVITTHEPPSRVVTMSSGCVERLTALPHQLLGLQPPFSLLTPETTTIHPKLLFCFALLPEYVCLQKK